MTVISDSQVLCTNPVMVVHQIILMLSVCQEIMY